MQDIVTKPPTLYDTDFYAWANEQAALLRAGRFSVSDIANIAEEIESLGKCEKRELVSRLAVLLMHLSKWRFQPNKRGKSWRLTIETQRADTLEHLAENPSLRSQIDDVLKASYRRARAEAAHETGLDPDTFPVVCPWTYDEIVDHNLWPES